MAFDNTLLGKEAQYRFNYDASVLFPIARADARAALGIGQALPFYGIDSWTAYELSWLNTEGLPQVAIAEFDFPCTALNLVESKSFKLYLNTFNNSQFAGADEVKATLARDLSAVAGAEVAVRLFKVDDYPRQQATGFTCIDPLSVRCEHYQPAPQLLTQGSGQVQEYLCSHVFRSLCPVTGQPDWASVYLFYQGWKIDHASLLQYLVSFRNHQGFHEQCVEQIFVELLHHCQPERLMVYARFMRRGGLDINPLRATEPHDFPQMLHQSRQ